MILLKDNIISTKNSDTREYLVLNKSGEINITLEDASCLNIVVIATESSTLSINIELKDPGCECNLSGLYIGKNDDTIDIKVNMCHSSARCRSKQLFKGVMFDRSHASFFGLIKVPQDSQQTEAYQENHNLLMSDDASVYSLPQLEIYADDVKCTHGATTGRLNEDELFYLRSRGLSLDIAKRLQILAFANEVLTKINDDTLLEETTKLLSTLL